MILLKYLAREILLTLSVVCLILLVIFLSNQFVRYLSYAAAGKLAVFIVLRVMLLEIPHLLGLLLPVGLFLAILLTLGRMLVDNELIVLASSGIGPLQLLRYILVIALFVMVLVGTMTLYFNPHIIAYKDKLLSQVGTEATLERVLPGRFQATQDGRMVVYVSQMTLDRNQMRGVFIAQHKKPDQDHPHGSWALLTAEKGYQQKDKVTGERYFVTSNGYRYIGTPGDRDYQVVAFSKYGLKVQLQQGSVSNGEDRLSNHALWAMADKNPAAMAELQWRISIPLSVLLLAFLAVSMVHLKPRQGRFVMIMPAIMIYIVYANLLILSRAWVEQSRIPPWLGMWWVHGLLLLLIVLLAASQYSFKTWLAVLGFKQRRPVGVQAS